LLLTWPPELAAWMKSRFGSVWLGTEQCQASHTANSRASVLRTGTCSGV
jgi:hypothetical protein